jgi:NADPH-dependent 7-cyano-7-deazaguanine reductase QueF
MSFPELVKVGSTATVTAHAPIKHECPFKNEVDTGTITITWKCNGFTFELHSLAEYLACYADQAISHEDLVALIAADLQTVGGGVTIHSVTARFTTAGIDVEISRGAVHVDAVES